MLIVKKKPFLIVERIDGVQTLRETLNYQNIAPSDVKNRGTLQY